MSHRRPPRPGFTLIELLVVIAIIAVLVSLTAAAVMRVRGTGPVAQARSDITGLTSAVSQAREQFHVKYIPSRIVLRENNAYNSADPLERRSVAFLQQMFGRRLNLATGSSIDWNGDGAISTNPVTLEGQECLVFFVGGIPSPSSGPSGCLGFSQDPTNPALAGGARTGPFFPFKTNRLVRGANGFFTYLDAFSRGKPYAYFSAIKGNDYTADCPSLQLTPTPVAPYQQSAARFMNPDTFQIISAGPDGVFGAGGLWDPASGQQGVGADDLSNFSGVRLGSAQS